MFSVVDAALLRPLPYRAPERLIEVVSVEGTGQRVPMGAVELFQLEKQATTLEAIGIPYEDVTHNGKRPRLPDRQKPDGYVDPDYPFKYVPERY
jgi:hypothetical protein